MVASSAHFRVSPLTQAEGLKILDWRYDPPYDFYNPPLVGNTDKYLQELLDKANGFHGVRDRHNRFIGFCSFGFDGQVLGGCYPDGPVDIGLGMAPNIVSQGNGREFFKAIVKFAISHYAATNVRLTVALFNVRAIRVYRELGFVAHGTFADFQNNVEHMIMELPVNAEALSKLNSEASC